MEEHTLVELYVKASSVHPEVMGGCVQSRRAALMLLMRGVEVRVYCVSTEKKRTQLNTQYWPLRIPFMRHKAHLVDQVDEMEEYIREKLPREKKSIGVCVSRRDCLSFFVEDEVYDYDSKESDEKKNDGSGDGDGDDDDGDRDDEREKESQLADDLLHRFALFYRSRNSATLGALEESFVGIDELLGVKRTSGPFFGGKDLNFSDCYILPKLMHTLMGVRVLAKENQGEGVKLPTFSGLIYLKRYMNAAYHHHHNEYIIPLEEDVRRLWQSKT